MVSTRKSLQPVQDNVLPTDPMPAGKQTNQVTALKAELEKKEAENQQLLANIATLTNALNGMNLVQSKMDKAKIIDDTTAAASSKKNKNEGPLPAKTAYKFFCDDQTVKEGVDLRALWKACPDQNKAKYLALAETDKARFLQQQHVYETEKTAMELFQKKKQQDLAMEFYQAHQAAQDAIQQAASDNKKKTKKDPAAPKHPMSAFLYFSNEKRAAVKSKNPSASVTEISKILGETWKSTKNTSKWENMAAVDKQRYETEKAAYDAMIQQRKESAAQEAKAAAALEKQLAMEHYQAHIAETSSATSMVGTTVGDDNISTLTDTSKVNNNKKQPKKKKDPSAPKHSMSAYLFFCNEQRNAIKAEMPADTSNAALLKEVGARWLALADKSVYKAKSNADKERYAQEMAVYNKKA